MNGRPPRLLRAETVGERATAVTVHAAPQAARRMPREVLSAKEEATRILEDAKARGAAIVNAAREQAALEAEAARARVRAEEQSHAAAWMLRLRTEEERALDRNAERVIELAKTLAERIVEETVRLAPEIVVQLAAAALGEIRGARAVRIEGCREDGPALEALRAELHPLPVELTFDAELGRGSLVIYTEAGTLDARTCAQLDRLAPVLREALGH